MDHWPFKPGRAAGAPKRKNAVIYLGAAFHIILREVFDMAAYILVDNKIIDREDFNEYVEKIPQVIAAHGGRFLARGGTTRVVEGDYAPERIVVLEFESYDRAVAFVSSPEYVELSVIRNRSTNTSTIIVDGV